jgi:hypothetical protein
MKLFVARDIARIRNDFREECRFTCLETDLHRMIFEQYVRILKERDRNSYCIWWWTVRKQDGLCSAEMLSFRDFRAMGFFFGEYYPDIHKTAEDLGMKLHCIAGSLMDQPDYMDNSGFSE